VPATAGVGAVDEVDRVGDLAGAADVLGLDAGGVLALFLLPGLVEDRDRVRVAHVPDDEVAHDAQRLALVPHRVVEQPLGLVRRAVPGVLGDRPAVLAGDVAGQPVDVLARLHPHLPAGEGRAQTPRELVAVGLGALGGL